MENNEKNENLCKKIIKIAEKISDDANLIDNNGVAIRNAGNLIWLKSDDFEIIVKTESKSIYEIEFKGKFFIGKLFDIENYIDDLIRKFNDEITDEVDIEDYFIDSISDSEKVNNDIPYEPLNIRFNSLDVGNKQGFFIDADDYEVSKKVNGLYPVTRKQ